MRRKRIPDFLFLYLFFVLLGWWPLAGGINGFNFGDESKSLIVAVNGSSLPMSGSFLYYLDESSDDQFTLLSIVNITGGTSEELCTVNSSYSGFGADNVKNFSWSVTENYLFNCIFVGSVLQPPHNISASYPKVAVKIGGDDFVGCVSSVEVQGVELRCGNITNSSLLTFYSNSDNIPCNCTINDTATTTVTTSSTSSPNTTTAEISVNSTTTAVTTELSNDTTPNVTTSAAEIYTTAANDSLTTANFSSTETTTTTESSNTTTSDETTTLVVNTTAITTTNVTKNDGVALPDVTSTTLETTTEASTTTSAMTTTEKLCEPPCVVERGTCENGNCACATGYVGLYCAYRQMCSDGPCKNGGSCQNTDRSSSNGTDAQDNTFTCTCTSDFEGTLCESAKGGGLSGGAIAVIILCILLVICLIVGGLFLFRYVRRSRKLKGKYNPAKEEMTSGNGPAMPMQTMSRDERLI